MIKLFLKTYIAKLMSPTPILGVLLLIGLYFLIKKRESLFKYTYISLSIFFFVTSCNLIPDYLLNKYETVYPKLAIKTIQGKIIPYIVVLGGGLDPAKHQPLSSQLRPQTLIRLIEGIRLHRLIPGSKLIVSGKGYANMTEAQAMGNMAIQLGVLKEDIIEDPLSENTKQHPINLKPIMNGGQFILVTSALHMNRAMAYFKKNGLHPIAAPTEFILKGNYRGFFSNILIYPDGENLFALDKLCYEIWGYLVGYIKNDL
jgi:uncharacterized SAM-binding protein YcdF (DUF218 family)